MEPLEPTLDRLAADIGFSGAVSVDRGGGVELAKAYGLAHRALAVANRVDTQFGIASGVKGFTAVTIASLIEEGALDLATPARTWLGADLPLIDGGVTVEHLLAHRSGIGDYLDEDSGADIADYLMPVPVHRLVVTEDYLQVLDGHPAKFAPGERFSYCNGGFVVLALIAERATGTPFHDLVHERVCRPAAMHDTAFLRSDELPGRAAIGYLPIEGVSRSNVLHLPVRGSGDGGIYSTLADIGSFWSALSGGRLVSPRWVHELTRARSDDTGDPRRYGLGFWLHPSRDVAVLEGYDAGVSFRTWHDPSTGAVCTVMSNTSDGAWPVCRLLSDVI